MNRKELLEIIEQASIDKRTLLDLAGKAITELPPEIGKLTNLTALFLFSNQLTELPPEVVKPTKQTTPNLKSNKTIKEKMPDWVYAVCFIEVYLTSSWREILEDEYGSGRTESILTCIAAVAALTFLLARGLFWFKTTVYQWAYNIMQNPNVPHNPWWKVFRDYYMIRIIYYFIAPANTTGSDDFYIRGMYAHGYEKFFLTMESGAACIVFIIIVVIIFKKVMDG